MNDVAAEPQPEPVRERGWWRVVLATVLFLFIPMTPVLKIALPVNQVFVLLASAIAACALAGWWLGGRPAFALVWTALAGWTLYTVGNGGLFDSLVAGWAAAAALTFAGLAAVARRRGSRSFSSLALASIAIVMVIATASAIVARASGGASVVTVVSTEAARRSTQERAAWKQTTASKEWAQVFAGNDDAKTISETMESQLESAPQIADTLFPSLLALETLVALAIGWAVYHRVGHERLGPPLAALKDFRFSDQFVWGLVAGLAMVVLPGFASTGIVSTAGANLLMFFGALYALRGVGVALWFLSPGRLFMAFLILFALVFGQVLGILAVGVGVGDTWLNWRARAKPKT